MTYVGVLESGDLASVSALQVMDSEVLLFLSRRIQVFYHLFFLTVFATVGLEALSAIPNMTYSM